MAAIGLATMQPSTGNTLLPVNLAMPRRQIISWLLLLVLALFAGNACTGQPVTTAEDRRIPVSLTVDGQTHNLISEAANVRELLEEAGVSLAPADQVTPPLFTPLTANMSVSVVRVTERIEVIEESIPFQRKTVRSEAMSADAPPRIVQGGRNGLQEITVRTVFHDGVEVERQRTKVTVIEEAQDEIVMIGVGNAAGAFSFDGTIAYISGGNSLVMRGSTLFPESLDTGGNLDGRVFKLSPTGSHLLYTRVMSDTGRFNNSLWLLSTEPGAEPRSLGVENVLWADWNPSLEASMQIAYTTANAVSQPPGWEANNDLWVATVRANPDLPFSPRRIVETYPATYGWWGGNFTWSPTGRYIAYAYADEVGVIDVEAPSVADRRVQLHAFTEYNTRAEWVWVPSISWSPDGRYLVFSTHGGEGTGAMVFDIWVADREGTVILPFVDQAGMWSHPRWSPPMDASVEGGERTSYIAYLQATNPLDGLSSPYTLWVMDQDGSNARQVYPPVGEISRFPREHQFMAWGPTGRDLAFVFDDALYLLNLARGQVQRITQDDSVVSRPTWAPYGAGVSENLAPTEEIPLPEPAGEEPLFPRDR